MPKRARGAEAPSESVMDVCGVAAMTTACARYSSTVSSTVPAAPCPPITRFRVVFLDHGGGQTDPVGGSVAAEGIDTHTVLRQYRGGAERMARGEADAVVRGERVGPGIELEERVQPTHERAGAGAGAP